MPGSEENRITTQSRKASRFYRRPPGLGWLLALLLVPLLLAAIGYSARDRSDKDVDLTLPSADSSATMTMPSVTAPKVKVSAMSFAPLSISRNGNDFTLSGDLPDAAAKTSLLDSLKGAMGAAVNLIDNVNLKAGINAPDFSGLEGVFKAGKPIPDLKLSLNGDTITLTGTSVSGHAKAAVEAAAKAAWPDLKISNKIQVTAPTGVPGSPVPTPAPGCANLQADINSLLGTPINFNTGGFTLTAGTKQMLTQVADKLKACPHSRVAVKGYTDDTGSDAINVPLSGKRAKSVADFLVSRGVVGDAVTSQGLGSANPIASNDTRDGRARNRRVEVTVS
jgi:peptidoglycan-binding protein ArfA